MRNATRSPPGRGGAAGIGAGTSTWRERSHDSLVSIHFWRGVLGKGCPDSTHHGRIASPNALVPRKRSSGQAPGGRSTRPFRPSPALGLWTTPHRAVRWLRTRPPRDRYAGNGRTAAAVTGTVTRHGPHVPARSGG